MTRDDIFWIAARLVALYLLIDAATAAPLAIASFGDSALADSERLQAKVRCVAPLVAAAALLEFTRRRSAGAHRSEIGMSLRRDDLLWVTCKALGLVLMVLAVDSAAPLRRSWWAASRSVRT